MEIKAAKILITGANRGIGRAVAKRLAEDGAHLILAVRKDNPNLEDELKQRGAASVTTVSCNLSSRQGVRDLIGKVEPMKVDILFNNAGLIGGGLLETQSADEIYEILQVNVNALVQLTQGLLPGMLKRGRGKVINQGSVLGVMPMPSYSVYCASKAAVIAFTHSLKQELKGTNVTTLTLVTPGVKTDLFDSMEAIHGQNMKLPKSALTVDRYAEMIREAIVADLEVLNPSGMMGSLLHVVRHLPSVWDKAISFRFKRS